jgi:hypothetical protein
MSYNYTLAFTAFQAEDNTACLKAIREAEPDIGDYMEIVDGDIVFYPDDSNGKWNNCEDAVIHIIKDHIVPGTTCTVYWQGEDDEMGGTLIGRDCCFTIIYEPLAVMGNANIPLHEARALLTGESAPFQSSWDYHEHGSHIFFHLEEWRADVAKGDTILGYQEWVKHNLETLLHDIDLTGVDAIEVAGCTEADGIVEVKSETDAKFFSVYTHRSSEGVQCQCDFNTKKQALEFARSLAGRTKIPVYGNMCDIGLEALP